MREKALLLFAAIFAAIPISAQDAAWQHSFGLRAGSVGILPLAYSLSAFHEAQSSRNMAIRSVLETTNGREFFLFGDLADLIHVRRVGAMVDFIYYTSTTRPIGTGFFVVAGLGAHRYSVKEERHLDYDYDPIYSSLGESEPITKWYRHTGASLALGLGFMGKKMGFEFKSYTYLDSSFPKSVSTESIWDGLTWFQTSMLFRFPMPGQQKSDSVREANYLAQQNAKKMAREMEAQESVPLNKIGLRFGGSSGDSGCGSIFYEHQFDGHLALRPAIEITKGSEGYHDVQNGYYRDVDVDRVGLAADCIYYVSNRWKDGTKFYLLTGFGVHKIDMKHEFALIGADDVYTECSILTPALSVGLGCYFSKYFGVEYKHTFSAVSTPYPGNVGRTWGQLTLNLRLPL